MTENDIMHENGDYWVGRNADAYTVYVTGATHSVADSSYHRNADGLSIATVRCDYLARTGDSAKRFAALSRNQYA